MALVLANSQSELLPLERGMHALRSGKGVREYAREIERDHALVVRERKAAEVVTQVTTDRKPLADKAKQLAELHAAASWLWPTLVARLILERWNVETAHTPAASRTRPSRRRGRTARRSPRFRCRPDEVPRRGPWAGPHPRLSG
jgi:hypothetical protein